MIQKSKKLAAKNLVQFRILPENIDVSASQTQTILQALIDSKVDIDHSCDGMGSCGTCRVVVEQGLDKFAERGNLELEIASDRKFAADERLSCQNLVKDGLILRKPQRSLT